LPRKTRVRAEWPLLSAISF